jgi:hypothetical protein
VSGQFTDLPYQWGAVTLLNDEIEVVVLTQKGADIYALVDRHSGVDVLFKAPWGARAPSGVSPLSTSAERWLDTYPGGWQVLLPNGGDECVQYGVTWGFHGEAALIPWSVLEQSATSITLEARLVTAPLEVRRELSIDGPVLRVHETVTNVSTQPVEVMWSHHPAFGAPFLDETCLVSAGCRIVIADDVAPGTVLKEGSTHSWPMALDTRGEPVDFTKVPAPDQPRSVLAYLTNFDSGYYAITNPTLGLGVGVRWPLEVFDKAWLWQEMNAMSGWPWFERAFVMAIEPASTIPGRGMETARAQGHRGVEFAPKASKDVLIEVVLFEGTGEIAGIDAGGVVRWATD